MANAQGASKTVAYKVQSALGTAASGSGGQLLRRRTFLADLARDTYESDEIVSHKMHTGQTAGIIRGSAKLAGLLSGGTYQAFLGSLLRKAWAATSNITGLSLTIASSGSGVYTITRGSGDFLTGGIKIGDIVRITAGSVAAANLNKNLLVTGVAATVLTVVVLNSSALTAEGPIASCTIAVPGKKVWTPTSSHTDDYYTIEEWYSDLSRSEAWTDCKIVSAAIGLPASGNATIDFDLLALNRSRTGSQVLTSPTAESTAALNQAVNGRVVVGSTVTTITGGQVTINGGDTPGEAEVGSNAITDTDEGIIKVSGQFTAKFSGMTLQDLYDNQTPSVIILTCAVDSTAGSEFVTVVLPRCKIFSDTPDDGTKAIVRTYKFTAEYNGSGGAALASHATIVSIQDSLAS